MEWILSFLKSPDGDVSAKRVVGTFVMMSALALLIVGAVIKNSDMQSTGRFMLVVAGGMLGITAFEHIGRR